MPANLNKTVRLALALRLAAVILLQMSKKPNNVISLEAYRRKKGEREAEAKLDRAKIIAAAVLYALELQERLER